MGSLRRRSASVSARPYAQGVGGLWPKRLVRTEPLRRITVTVHSGHMNGPFDFISRLAVTNLESDFRFAQSMDVVMQLSEIRQEDSTGELSQNNTRVIVRRQLG